MGFIWKSSFFFFFLLRWEERGKKMRRRKWKTCQEAWEFKWLIEAYGDRRTKNERDLSRNPRRLQQQGVKRPSRALATQLSPWRGWMECLREQSSSPCFVFPPYTLPPQRHRCPTANRWRTRLFASAQGCPLWAVIISLPLNIKISSFSMTHMTWCTQFPRFCRSLLLRTIWPWWPTLRLLEVFCFVSLHPVLWLKKKKRGKRRIMHYALEYKT